jgi:hypothetical protein
MAGGQALAAPSTTKKKTLFVDEEMYGSLEFPRSFDLGRGQLLRLAGYGEVQVVEVTIDTLTTTKEISKELNDEYKRNPPGPDPVPEQPVAPPGGAAFPGAGPLSGASCSIPGGERAEPKYPTLGGTDSSTTSTRFL